MRFFRLTLSPAGRHSAVPSGTRLQDVLFDQGAEFPCGGRGRCNKCRVRLLEGELAPTPEEAALLSPEERAQGWRLACRHVVEGDLTLELAQWEMPVLGDESEFGFVPGNGFGAAVDLGTTTIAVQLLDLAAGRVLASETALNAQARHGADLISRIGFALHGGAQELTRLVREQVGGMIEGFAVPLQRVCLVGNTVMHHLFCGIDVAPLAMHPFDPAERGRVRLSESKLGWSTGGTVEFLPCIGGLVGPDILAGIVATGLQNDPGFAALIDLGTNGEIVVAHDGVLLCASTAAGPAFEGARIAMGMRAATGAIDTVETADGEMRCRVIGGGAARGLCGSGLVDAVAAGLDLSIIEPSGRMIRDSMPLSGRVTLTPRDVRELQLAKGAIAAGLRLLTGRFGLVPADIGKLHLAGAFGNAVSRTSAVRIGLLRLPAERIVPAGNAALLGAKRALFEDTEAWDSVALRIEHVALHEDPRFQDIFAEEMRFPSPT